MIPLLDLINHPGNGTLQGKTKRGHRLFEVLKDPYLSMDPWKGITGET
jgi:hypothetical protein